MATLKPSAKHLAEAETQQEERVALMKQKSLDTSLAEEVLDTMQAVLVLMRNHHAQLEAEVSKGNVKSR
jgi:hypothetical protein